MYITNTFPAVPDAPADCAITTLIYDQSSGMLFFINSIWDAVKVSKLPNIALGYLLSISYLTTPFKNRTAKFSNECVEDSKALL